MITHLRGTMTFKCPTFVVLEAGGVGYQVFISLHTYSQLLDTPTIFLLTHQFIKEDSHTLYGFSEEKERTLFRLLISVSGVGPTTAQVLLSSISPDEIRSAILSEKDEIFRKAKGIGPKTAKRIILDLKDKMVKDSGEGVFSNNPSYNTIRDEALSALVALGFNRGLVQKAIQQILQDAAPTENVENLIKKALKLLSQ
jgi:Holliday junction DNA helicase RuvA